MRWRFFHFLIGFLFLGQIACAQGKEPWKNNQLMPPAVLAEKINNNQTGNLLIINIGPDAVIKGSVDVGPAQEAGNIKKLKDQLKKVKKDKEVVIYCGCCPFSRCPNVRPAFKTLVDAGFKNAYLLDIPRNIKADWIDKKYPVAE